MFQEEGTKLVAVFNVEPLEMDARYPYRYGGIEPPPGKVGEMGKGFYAWDLNQVLKIE